MVCHPDKFIGNEAAKITNLAAVQTLNQMIDNLEQFNDNDRDLKDEYTIDFVVPSSGQSARGSAMTTRRSVVLSFPVINYRDQQGNVILMRRAKQEIIRLLKVAGVSIKSEYEQELKEEMLEQDSQESSSMRSFDGLSFAEQFPGSADWRRKRSGFKIDWKEEERLYQEATAKMNRDIGTLGMTTDHQKRQLVAGIISRIRFLGDIDIVDELATLRRLSLLLEDNFDLLGFEDIGVICTQMIIVIKDYNKLRLMQSEFEETRRRIKGESGYVFSWDGEGVVTVTIPLNFKEWQLLKEFDKNLHVYLPDGL